MNIDGVILRLDMNGLPQLKLLSTPSSIGFQIVDCDDIRAVNTISVWCDVDCSQRLVAAVNAFNSALMDGKNEDQ